MFIYFVDDSAKSKAYYHHSRILHYLGPTLPHPQETGARSFAITDVATVRPQRHPYQPCVAAGYSVSLNIKASR